MSSIHCPSPTFAFSTWPGQRLEGRPVDVVDIVLSASRWWRAAFRQWRDQRSRSSALDGLRELDAATLRDLGIGASELESVHLEARGDIAETRRRIGLQLL